MSNVWKIVLAVIGALAGLVLIAVLSFGWRWVTAPFYGQLEQRETVQSGQFRIFSYNHFFDLCAAIQRKQRALEAQESQLEAAESSGERQRIRTRIAALKGQIQSDVSSYNADSRKEKTTGQFKAAGLPPRIQYTTERIVSCR